MVQRGRLATGAIRARPICGTGRVRTVIAGRLALLGGKHRARDVDRYGRRDGRPLIERRPALSVAGETGR